MNSKTYRTKVPMNNSFRMKVLEATWDTVDLRYEDTQHPQIETVKVKTNNI